MQKHTISRREIIKLAWKGLLGISGMLGLAGFIRFLDYMTVSKEVTVFNLGLLGIFPPGSKTIIREAQAIIINQSGKISAYSIVCPHLGCQVYIVQDGFACPCHGSKFDLNGKVTRGPSTSDLRQLTLELNDKGYLILRTN